MTVFETYADRAKEGADAGREDGALALQCAQELSIPTSAILYFAVDFDAQSGDMDAIEEYLMTAKANIGDYDIGVYGSFDVISEMGKRGVCKGHWQTYAWSHGFTSSYMNVYQYQNGEEYAGIAVDYNEADSLVGMWSYRPVKTEIDIAMEKMLAKGIYKEDRRKEPLTRGEYALTLDRLKLLG
jgi:hypothetical protein